MESIVNTITFVSVEQQELLIEDVRIENHFIMIRHDADIHGCIGSPVNQSVTLTCKADGYQEISWYKNGGLLDLNNEEIMFNQTTGDLVIRREYACDLLGVYQCFASNEIDTVHVSTRVLPFGKEILLIPVHVHVIMDSHYECTKRHNKPSRGN